MYTRRGQSRDGVFKGGQVQILEIIVNDFIHDTDYSEIKAIARNAQASSIGLTYNM